MLSTCPSRSDAANGSFWSLGWIGGRANSVKRTDTAYVHRDMMSLLRPTPVWPNDAPASVANDLEAWTDDVVKAIRTVHAGGRLHCSRILAAFSAAPILCKIPHSPITPTNLGDQHANRTFIET